MKTRRFRESLSPREPLAIDPRALEIGFGAQDVKEIEQQEQIALVSICGPLEHHKSWMWDSYDAILARLEDAFSCDDVAAVVMCIDSPGGDAAGATEAHRQIQRLKKKHKKPLYAYSNEAMYSAAYSIGSAADEIWVPETGGVGSVGVICALLDKTKQNKKLGLNIKLLTTGTRKADTHADRELTEDVIDAMQERVDYLGDVFFKTVAKARGISLKAVKDLQANIFFGQQAVDAGLADGVAGWYKFLQYVTSKLDSPAIEDENDQVSTEDSEMKTLAELKKLRDAAAKKLAGAKSAVEHKKLFAAYESAVKALSAAQISAKTKYVKKTEETEETDEDEEEEEEEEDEEEEEEDDDDDDKDDDDDSDEEEEEEEEEEEDEDEEKKSKKMKKKASASSMSLKNVQRLFQVAKNITGKDNFSEMIGALEGMTPRVKNLPKVEERLAKIEQTSRRSRVKSMLEKACTERRITKAQSKGLLDQGLKDPKWLKGYLSQQPPMYRSTEDGGLQPDIENMSTSLDNMTTDQRKMLQQAAESANMTVEDYSKEIQKHTHGKPNGAAPKY